MRRVVGTSIILLTFAIDPLRAEVRGSAPDSMLIVHAATVRATPAAVYRALGRVGSWWSDQHTWSGAARNMTLELRAGGCFCEGWAGGTVEHGHVILAQTDQVLRLNAALGPLQELAIAGVLSFTVTGPGDGGTRLEVTYRVSGDATHGLDKLSALVDTVIGEQVARLARYAETGRATP
jgi:hypothetical protein